MNLQELIPAVTGIAREAGHAIMNIYKTGTTVETKADDSPITAAKYNRWLVGEQNRGAGGIVRSEMDELRKDRKPVDPLQYLPRG